MHIIDKDRTRASSTWRAVSAVVAAVLLVALLTGCFATQQALTSNNPMLRLPGFFAGFWHGFIAPVAFVTSLFSDHVRIYAVPNAGRWYDFGFMLGISGFSGGIFAGSRSRTRG
jgi:hypothetical protein